MSDQGLKAHLFAAYNGFSDKRIKNLEKSDLFIVDDRSGRDLASDGTLYSYFCKMFARVVAPDAVEVQLSGNIPSGEEVTAWIAKHGSSLRDQPSGVMTVSVPLGQESLLEDLATAMRSIVRPGAPRYAEPNYKYVCPRTAASLDRLAKVLRTFPRGEETRPA
jgi:hypothetical protein